MSPRFQGSNLDSNLALVDQLRAIAEDIGASPAQVAIAWVAAQGNDIVPLVGARRRDRLTEALGALDVKLTPAHLAASRKGVSARRRCRCALSGGATGAHGQREEADGVIVAFTNDRIRGGTHPALPRKRERVTRELVTE